MLREEKTKFVRESAAEGMVLFENDGLLPLKKGTKVALFGVTSYHCFKLGWGSGDMLAQVITQVNEGLENAGFILNKDLDSYIKEKMLLHADEYKCVNRNWFYWTYRYNEIEIPEEMIKKSSGESDVAIITIGRCSGESDDLKDEEGFFRLHTEEVDLIKNVSSAFDKVVLILNTCGPLDLRAIDDCNINAILYASMGGEQFGNSVSDILSGKVTPSGKLSTTWAFRYDDYPTKEGITSKEVPYNEGIYVGYRYFDTFNVNPRYPFGFGLSYTDFDIKVSDYHLDGTLVDIYVDVTNKGNLPGKEIVQCYVSSPDGKLEKSYQDLVAFNKTGLLGSGDVELLNISFDLADFGSFDEDNDEFVLEKGKYIVRIGNSSRNTHVAFVINLDKDLICEKVTKRLVVKNDNLKIISKKGHEPYSYKEEKEEIQRADVVNLDYSDFETEICKRYEDNPDKLLVPKKSDKVLTLDDVVNGKATLEDVVAQFSNEELSYILNGVIYEGADANANVGSMSIKVRGAAGEMWTSEKYKIPTNACADGPGGVRLSMFNTPEETDSDVCHKMVAFPSGTCLANSWNTQSAYTFGRMICDDLKISDIEGWLAPGINIHRNPLNGRNFEYLSEDPVLSGQMTSFVVNAVQFDEDSKPTGKYVTIKHFACNNIEYERGVSDSVVSVRALREIYLKNFRIAIMNSGSYGVMTSYNKINGEFASTSFDLLNGILRGEWGFDGFVCTDWNTAADAKKHPYAGNDLIMPGTHRKDILNALNEGTLDKACAQKCAVRILRLILRTNFVK